MKKRNQTMLILGLFAALGGILGLEYLDSYLYREAHDSRTTERIRAEVAARRAARAAAEERRAEWREAYRGRFDDPERWEAVQRERLSTPAAKRAAALAAVRINYATNPSTAQEVQ